MNGSKLQEILKKHKAWVKNEPGGKRANLRSAVLQCVDLQCVDLRGADLQGADMCWSDLRDVDLRGANLQCAALRYANLRGANIDFSSWPLWCGGLHVKTDKRIACQLAYHFCSLDCDDEQYIAARNAILDFANQFHMVDECGRLEFVNQNAANGLNTTV